MTEESSETSFLIALFEALTSSGIRYAVMRNYASLPFSAGGSDLDIMISPAEHDRALGIVLDVIASCQGVPVGQARNPGLVKIHAIGRSKVAAYPWWGVKIDLFSGFHYCGLDLLNPTSYWPLADHRQIAVLGEGFAGVLGVLKEALHNHVFSERYADAAREAAQTNWPEIEGLLTPMGDIALGRFKSLLLSNAEPALLADECRLLSRDVRNGQFKKNASHFVRQVYAYYWSKVCRYVKPSGVVVAVLGVDGAGKSTVINAILPALRDATHNAVVLKHLRPGLLPPLARLVGKSAVAEGPVLEPHGAKSSGALLSLFRCCYLMADYVVGYWVRVRPQIAKLPNIVVFDRYAYDMRLDPRRFRIRLPPGLIAGLVSLAPKPDLIICLCGNPEAIAARKDELSPDETRRQIVALTSFAKSEPRAFLVSTDVSIEESRDDTLGSLLNCLKKRVAIER